MTVSLLNLWLPVLIGGAAVGMFYFGGLWWTVRRLPVVKRPAVLSLGSFYIRAGVSLAAFYFIMGGHWERLVVSLLGFTAVRLIMVRRIRPQ